MAEKEQIRLQVFVDQDVVDRIDDLAGRVGASRNDMARWLLELSTSDEQYLINKFSAWIAGKLKNRKGKQPPKSS